MRILVYGAAAASTLNTVILSIAYLWDSSVALVTESSSFELTPDGAPAALSFVTTLLLLWHLYALRRADPRRLERRRLEQ